MGMLNFGLTIEPVSGCPSRAGCSSAHSREKYRRYEVLSCVCGNRVEPGRHQTEGAVGAGLRPRPKEDMDEQNHFIVLQVA